MNYNNHHFNKLLSIPVKKLVKIIVDVVHTLSPIKDESFARNKKYSIEEYAIGMIDVMKHCTSWNSYSGIIKGNTLRKKHYEWNELGVYEEVYTRLTKKYIKTTRVTKEFKTNSIDSTFIEDKNGSKEAAYNNIYKRRKGEASKGIKITSIVTNSGIPISVDVDPANKYDSTILPKMVDNIVIECNTKKYEDHNRYKQYMLADAGYDSVNNKELLEEKGYTPIIAQNKRNIKNKKLIRKMSNLHKKIYKKRTIIENYHSWIKKMAKISSLYERKISNYKGLLFLGISLIISRRIIKNLR